MRAQPPEAGIPSAVPPTRITPVHGRNGAIPPPATNRRMRIGEALVAAGVIDNYQLGDVLTQQAAEPPSERRRLGDIVVSMGLATEDDVARALATAFGFEYVDLSTFPLDPAVARAVPRELAVRLKVVPLDAGGSWVKVAIADPTDRAALDQVRHAARVPSVSIAVAAPDAIVEALHVVWGAEYDPPAPPALAPASAPPAAVAPPVRPTEPASSAVPAAAVPAAAAITRPPSTLAAGESGWDYTLIGDALPMDHPGYTHDAAVLQAALRVFGREGWEAVGVHSNGSRMAVLLKRPLR